MSIRLTQSRHILGTQITSLCRVTAAPGEGSTAKAGHQQIGHESSVPTVSVGERVDGYQAVMKAHCQFIGSEYHLFHPQMGVVEQPAKVCGDSPGGDADVLLCGPISARPCLHLAERPFMQIADETFV